VADWHFDVTFLFGILRWHPLWVEQGKYRWRARVRERLPRRLGWLSPKGRVDCGNHDWYNEDNRVERCYYCVAGVRDYSPEHFK
jgi:hypothetical protein